MNPDEDDVLEVHGLRFLYDTDDDEIWLWEERDQVWSVLPMIPEYLEVVNGKLTLKDLFGKKTNEPHKCRCPILDVWNFGCQCGGV